jgi:hypothetical protein
MEATKYTHNLASQNTTPEGRVRNESDAELATDAQDADLSILNLQIEWRILDLHSCYGMYCVRPTDGRGRDLRQTDIPDLACPR